MDIDIRTILAEQRSLSEALAAEKNVTPDIDPDDMLFDFFVRHVFPTNNPQTVVVRFCAR